MGRRDGWVDDEDGLLFDGECVDDLSSAGCAGSLGRVDHT
jgi:hypothetical protein